MDASSKMDLVRQLMIAFPEPYAHSTLHNGERHKLEEVAVAAIRGVITVDDAPPKPPKPVTCEEFKVAMSGKKIAAIKALRNRGSVAGVEGLKDAKEAVEEIMSIFADSAIERREDMPF